MTLLGFVYARELRGALAMPSRAMRSDGRTPRGLRRLGRRRMAVDLAVREREVRAADVRVGPVRPCRYRVACRRHASDRGGAHGGS